MRVWLILSACQATRFSRCPARDRSDCLDEAKRQLSVTLDSLWPANYSGPTFISSKIAGGNASERIDTWWKEKKYLQSEVTFDDNTLSGSTSVKYATLFMGQVRTWATGRKMFHRTLFNPNRPVDLFFTLYANSDEDIQLIKELVIPMPNRRLHVKHWGLPIVNKMQKEHNVRICNNAPRPHEVCTMKDTTWGNQRTHSKNLHVLSKARMNEVAWFLMKNYVAIGRGGSNYDLVVTTRMDLSYPPQPLDLQLAFKIDALLIPAGGDLPVINDQFALGRPRWLEAYMTHYSLCRHRIAATTSNSDLVNHPCASGSSIIRSIQAHVPNKNFRRFWWQYWIIRLSQRDYFERYNETAYRTFASPCCWQSLNWKHPNPSTDVLVDLNTVCTVNPTKFISSRISPRRSTPSVEQLKCRYIDSFCEKRRLKSTCSVEHGPPPGPPMLTPGEYPAGVFAL